PRSTERQKLVRSQLMLEPIAGTLDQDRDYFGNVVHYFSLQEAHRRLAVTAVSEIELLPVEAPNLGESEAWEKVSADVKRERDPELLRARELTFDSPHVRPDAALMAFATPSFPAGRPLLEGSLDLTRRIHREFQYEPGSTSVATPLAEVLRTRRGVCQD